MKLLSRYIDPEMGRRHRTVNWEYHEIGDLLIYSHRDTHFTRATFPSDLHCHDYYELLVLVRGEVDYVCESPVYHPSPFEVVLTPPGKFHMFRLVGDETRYERHVFYFYPEALEVIGAGALTAFLSHIEDGCVLSIRDPSAKEELASLLSRLSGLWQGNVTETEKALSLSHIIGIFYLLNREFCRPVAATAMLPDSIRALRDHIDRHYASIRSVSDVAQHFFYTREHISRLFRQHFDTTIADYLSRRRIAESRRLILRGVPLIEVAEAVGFGSLSTFIRAFRAETDMTPSEYRKFHRKNKKGGSPE